ncbi:MAG: hypothetical protein QM674_16650 [Burkholderiaceae bacterium]
MNADGGIWLLLATCSLVIAALQAADWRAPLRWTMLAAGVLALAASGELASRTSPADLLRWAASPQRRQDLAALLLAEALLFGSHAARLARGRASGLWRALDGPPPSALLALFFAQVAVMLRVDGWDYGTLSWLCAVGFALILAAASGLLRRALPDEIARGTLRVGLHAVQAMAGLWLARPAFQAPVDPVPLWGERLAVLAATVAALVALGWLLQRRRRREADSL